MAFHHAWPALEKWFDGKQNILVRVDANVDLEELYSSLKSIFQQAMLKKQEGNLSFYYEANISSIRFLHCPFQKQFVHSSVWQ